MDKLKSTKVQLVWFFALTSTIMLYLDKLDGSGYVALVTILYTSFGVVNVAQKKVLNESRTQE